jgi:peptidoglycan/LPS O-acetylase OafA/YrhL
VLQAPSGAGVVQWQNGSFPSCIRGFDSHHPLQYLTAAGLTIVRDQIGGGMQTTTYRIRGFDGLRAVAVILVWLQHRTSLISINIGAYGVWLFFVMSGFLIIDILLRQRLLIEGGTTSPLAQWREFVFRRTLRIFPIYYLSLIVILPVLYALHLNHVDTLAVVMNLFYVSNVWIGQVLKSWPNNLSHLWSLSIEEQFYLLMPLIALSVSSRRLIWACAGVVATALLTKLLLHWAGTEQIAVFTSSIVNFGMIAYGGCCILSEKRSEPCRSDQRFSGAPDSAFTDWFRAR